MSVWEPYVPSAVEPWDLKKVGHLYRRAAFGATWAELQQGLADGPTKTIDRLLKGSPAGVDFERTSDFLASERNLPSGASGTTLAAWWLARILRSPHPLHEKITLFWHNHFATSLAKVQNARFMLGQYRLLSRHALGDFRQMLQEISLDPAMMIWLDTNQSVAGKPNENYARELMELFSLGIGHYTEKDIREAAKAFTGYVIKNGQGILDPKKHDDSKKSVLGQAGTWKAEDIVRICLEQPACPRFIVTKMYRYLINEVEAPAPELIEPLAEQYRASGFDTGKLVATMLRSKHFFSGAAYRQRVKPPVDFAVGTVRALEGTVGPLVLAEALESLGQVLFAPPSVKGWDGGTAWLNGQTLLFRQNLAIALTRGDDPRFANRCDPATLLAKHGKTTDDAIVDFLLGLFLQGDVPEEARGSLRDYLAQASKVKPPVYWSADDAVRHRLRAVTHLVLTRPEYQLS